MKNVWEEGLTYAAAAAPAGPGLLQAPLHRTIFQWFHRPDSALHPSTEQRLSAPSSGGEWPKDPGRRWFAPRVDPVAPPPLFGMLLLVVFLVGREKPYGWVSASDRNGCTDSQDSGQVLKNLKMNSQTCFYNIFKINKTKKKKKSNTITIITKTRCGVHRLSEQNNSYPAHTRLI